MVGRGNVKGLESQFRPSCRNKFPVSLKIPRRRACRSVILGPGGYVESSSIKASVPPMTVAVHLLPKTTTCPFCCTYLFYPSVVLSVLLIMFDILLSVAAMVAAVSAFPAQPEARASSAGVEMGAFSTIDKKPGKLLTSDRSWCQHCWIRLWVFDVSSKPGR